MDGTFSACEQRCPFGSCCDTDAHMLPLWLAGAYTMPFSCRMKLPSASAVARVLPVCTIDGVQEGRNRLSVGTCLSVSAQHALATDGYVYGECGSCQGLQDSAARVWLRVKWLCA